MTTLEAFRDEFFQLSADWTWQVRGFLDTNGYVHPIDTDTKVISTVFERLTSPIIRSIASKHDFLVETANQTTYPDFTLTKESSNERYALDVKTTYHSPTMGFTLGGYASFLRNNTKNILHPYDTYNEHWILGFIYSQSMPFREYTLEEMPKPHQMQPAYDNVVIFLRRKEEITGLRAGSGNTKNIGSIKLKDPEYFKTANGPFMVFKQAKAACDHYWRHYDYYKEKIKDEIQLANHPDFLRYK